MSRAPGRYPGLAAGGYGAYGGRGTSAPPPLPGHRGRGGAGGYNAASPYAVGSYAPPRSRADAAAARYASPPPALPQSRYPAPPAAAASPRRSWEAGYPTARAPSASPYAPDDFSPRYGAGKDAYTSAVAPPPRPPLPQQAAYPAGGRPRVTAAAGSGLCPAQKPGDAGKYSLVFDLDETLVYAREGPVRQRPGSSALLGSLGNEAEVMVWTAGERGYATNAVRQIDPGGAVRHTIARDSPGWFTGDRGCVKNLGLLGRDLSKTLLVENTPDCVAHNRDNAILVPDYTGAGDTGVLTKLGTVLRELVRSGKPVGEYLRGSPHVSKQSVRTQSGGSVECYVLQGHTPHAAPAAGLQLPPRQTSAPAYASRPPPPVPGGYLSPRQSTRPSALPYTSPTYGGNAYGGRSAYPGY